MKTTVERYYLDNCNAFKFYLPHFDCKCANKGLKVREVFEGLEILERYYLAGLRYEYDNGDIADGAKQTLVYF